MMMTDTFKPKTAEQVKMHRNLRWSSLRDWGTVVYRIVFKKGNGLAFSWLWIILFGLSVLSWSFALSGLTMQTQDGYKAGNVPGTKVTGVNQGSMGSRFSADIINAASYLWTLDSTPQIPSGGALYVPLNSSITTNVLKPNTLPSTAREIFLTAQAPVPITGSIWGAILKYNCSEVHRLDEFTILNRRINSSNPAYVQPAAYNDTDIAYFYTLDDGSSISVMSQLNGGFVNVAAFVEVGMSTGVRDILDRAPSLGYTSTSLGLGQEEVMELALWQTFWNPPGTFGNFTNVQDPIQELEDEHYEPQNPFGDGYPWDGNMSAIGIRCTSSSVTGTATVNGLVGTYTDFERENPSMDRFPTPRLSVGVPLMFLPLQQAAPDFVDYGYQGGLKSLGNYSVNYTVLNTKYDWITPLFMAANPDIDLDETSPRFAYYSSLIQTSELRDAFITAYQQYAIQLMFYRTNGGAAWENHNVTTSTPWTILQAGGGVPPIFIIITMLIWALGCAGLSLAYGFKKRWAETLDDHYLYCLCEKMPLDISEILKNDYSGDGRDAGMDTPHVR